MSSTTTGLPVSVYGTAITFANAANAKKILMGLLKANKGKEEDIELIRTAVSFDKKTFDPPA